VSYLPRKAVALLLPLAAVLMCTACAPPQARGGEESVFPASENAVFTDPASTDEILDIGIEPLQNVSGSSVKLTSVTLASPPAALRILNVRAYNAAQTQGFVLGQEGDLPTECPRQYEPHPVDAIITPAHQSSLWYVVIAVAFSKPGRYYLKRIRIDYTTDGHQGWQYQDIDTTVVISDPPDPGPKPLPSSAVCGLQWSRFRRRHGYLEW
jgi:hypothetical protein